MPNIPPETNFKETKGLYKVPVDLYSLSLLHAALYYQATRVLGIGTDQIVILDGTEHTLIASHPITTL